MAVRRRWRERQDLGGFSGRAWSGAGATSRRQFYGVDDGGRGEPGSHRAGRRSRAGGCGSGLVPAAFDTGGMSRGSDRGARSPSPGSDERSRRGKPARGGGAHAGGTRSRASGREGSRCHAGAAQAATGAGTASRGARVPRKLKAGGRRQGGRTRRQRNNSSRKRSTKKRRSRAPRPRTPRRG